MAFAGLNSKRRAYFLCTKEVEPVQRILKAQEQLEEAIAMTQRSSCKCPERQASYQGAGLCRVPPPGCSHRLCVHHAMMNMHRGRSRATSLFSHALPAIANRRALETLLAGEQPVLGFTQKDSPDPPASIPPLKYDFQKLHCAENRFSQSAESYFYECRKRTSSSRL